MAESRKRPRLDNGDEPHFKGVFVRHVPADGMEIDLRQREPVPSLPMPRIANQRQRGEETPSHPGGLSETARKKLEEHRRNRDRQKGADRFFCCFFDAVLI